MGQANLVLTKPATPLVGIGRDTQVSTAEHFGLQSPATGTEFGGMYIRTDSATAKPFYGYYAGTGTGKKAYHYYDGNTDNWAMDLNGTRLTLEGATGDFGADGDVDGNDFAVLQGCWSGSWLEPDQACDD